MLHGHFWSIAPRLRHGLLPGRLIQSEPWETIVSDDRWGAVRLTGKLTAVSGAETILVLVHGLGGCCDSHYVGPAVAAAVERGVATLRLNMRGSDLSGEDIYHAGLTADITAALESTRLASYESVLLLGFSLGGHLALAYAAEDPEPRLRSVAAICAPLDLAAGQRAFDAPSRWLYRRYVLGRLRAIYREVARHRELDVPLERVLSVATIRAWDEATVVPRFGFEDVDDYYRRASVAGRLGRLRVPALLVSSRSDPMVPPETVAPALDEAGERLEIRWVPGGGHVGFPASVDLGLGGRGTVDEQVVEWLAAADGRPS